MTHKIFGLKPLYNGLVAPM